MVEGQQGFVQEKFVAKPGPSLASFSYHSLGLSTSIVYQGKTVKVRHFKTRDDLIKSAKLGLDKNTSLEPELIGSLKLILEDPKAFYGWDAGLSESQINHAGAVIGEILPAILLIENDYSAFDKPLFTENITDVYFPEVNSFPLVDLFLRLETGKLVAISHKFAEGAGASLLSNVVFPLFDRAEALPVSLLAELKGCDLPGLMRNKALVFNYWLKHLLGVQEPLEFGREAFLQIREGNISPRLQGYLDRTQVPENLVEFWPKSITYLICQELKKRFKACPRSLEIINRELGLNGFWQFRLEASDWHKKARIKYVSTYSTDCQKVEIDYGKFSRADVSANQGMLIFWINH